MTVTTPRRRFGWPPARQRPIDQVNVVSMLFAVGNPPPSLVDLRFLLRSHPTTTLLGQNRPVAIIEDEPGVVSFDDVLDATLSRAAQVSQVPLKFITVAITDSYVDADTGITWAIMALAL